MSSGRVAGVVQEAAVLSMAVSSLEVVIEILGRLFLSTWLIYLLFGGKNLCDGGDLFTTTLYICTRIASR